MAYRRKIAGQGSRDARDRSVNRRAAGACHPLFLAARAATALAIASELADHAHKVSIVDATDDLLAAPDEVEIHAIGAAAYFDAQFKASLEVFGGDVMLHIAADIATRSWAEVARRCAARFARPPTSAPGVRA